MKMTTYTLSASRIVKFVSLVLAFVFAITLTTVPAFAATYTDEYVLETETIVLVDRSGSMKDRDAVNNVLATIDTSEATIAYFDSHKLTLDENYNIGGNSSICEAIDAAARGGFTHIAVVTDAEQWPENYSSLGIYTDLDIKIFLTEEKDAQAEKLIAELTDSLVKSNLTIVHVDGTEEVLMNDYVPEKHVVSIEVPDPIVPDEEEPDHGNPVDGTAKPSEPVIDQTVVECNHECTECTHRCPWWLVLLLAVVIAALFDFIHELITRNRNGMRIIRDRVADGSKVIIDLSGSMDEHRKDVLRAVRKGGAKKVYAFGSSYCEVPLECVRVDGCVEVPKSVPIYEQDGYTEVVKVTDDYAIVDMRRATRGAEVLKAAAQKGYRKVMLYSDMQFTGAELVAEDFEKMHFERITVVAAKPYDLRKVTELYEIADCVEVIELEAR